MLSTSTIKIPTKPKQRADSLKTLWREIKIREYITACYQSLKRKKKQKQDRQKEIKMLNLIRATYIYCFVLIILSTPVVRQIRVILHLARAEYKDNFNAGNTPQLNK